MCRMVYVNLMVDTVVVYLSIHVNILKDIYCFITVLSMAMKSSEMNGFYCVYVQEPSRRMV